MDAYSEGYRDGARDTKEALEGANETLREALEEIAEGKGTFSLNPFKHAQNTIEDMKNIAKAAISRTKGK